MSMNFAERIRKFDYPSNGFDHYAEIMGMNFADRVQKFDYPSSGFDYAIFRRAETAVRVSN